MECNDAPPRDISMLPTLDMVLFKPAHKHDEYNKIMKRSLVTLGFFSLALMLVASFAQAQEKPNVVFILADDLGYGDLGCYGHPYAQTPNINSLAKDGTRFTRFYATGVTCQPSRVGFMTSRHPCSFERRVGDYGFDGRPTITELLNKNGYATGHFGKWHIGPAVGGKKSVRPTSTC
jgi:N-acetylgalactosamine-6-sulfatase